MEKLKNTMSLAKSGKTQHDNALFKNSFAVWIRVSSQDAIINTKKHSPGKEHTLLKRKNIEDRPIIKGLFRIGIDALTIDETTGSVYAETGAPIVFPGVVIARTMEILNYT